MRSRQTGKDRGGSSRWQFVQTALPLSREACVAELVALDGVTALDIERRVALTPAVRRMCVEDAAYGRLPIGNGCKIAINALPPAMVAGASFIATYLIIFSKNPQLILFYTVGFSLTAVALAFGRRFPVAKVSAPLICIIMVAYIVFIEVGAYRLFEVSREWLANIVALVMGLTAGALVPWAGEVFRDLMREYVFYPRLLRGSRSFLSSGERAAVRIVAALLGISALRRPWQTPLGRRKASDLLKRAAKSIERTVPWEMWAAGAVKAERVVIRRRCRHAAAELRAQANLILEDKGAAPFDWMCEELAAAATALARGDWSPVTRQELAYRGVGSRLASFKAPAAFAVSAILVHFLPASLPGTQVVLMIAALLSLLRVEGTAQDRILQIYQDAGKS